MTLREKLLAAIDSEYFRENVSDSILLDLVLEQTTKTKQALFDAQQALIKEGMRADRAIERAEQIRGAAFKPPQGDFYFTFPDNTTAPVYVVSIVNGDVRLCRREYHSDYMMQPISMEEYCRRVTSSR